MTPFSRTGAFASLLLAAHLAIANPVTLTDGVTSLVMSKGRLDRGNLLTSAAPGAQLRVEADRLNWSLKYQSRTLELKMQPATLDWGSMTAVQEFEAENRWKGRITWHVGNGSSQLRVTIEGEDARAVSFNIESLLPSNVSNSTLSDTSVQFDASLGTPARPLTLEESQKLLRQSDPASWIQIDAPYLDQLALATLLRIVGRSVSMDPKGALGPFGSTHTKYKSRVFWDADTWVFPALMLLDPPKAKRIPDFRLRGVAPAREWSKVLAGNGYPKAGMAQPDRSKKAQIDAIRFPWEADEFGREAGTTESIYQEHINGSVTLGLEFAAALGLADPQQVKEVKVGVGNWYRLRSKRGPDGKWRLNGVMSPDESFRGDNDLYTNLLASRYTGNPYYLPRDKTTFLTYDGDFLRKYKQAAALLTLYPLEHPVAEAEAAPLLKRFLGKGTENGPAMSRSLDSLLEARYGMADKALEHWRDSWSKYAGGPRGLYSENPVSNDQVFVTGAAGSINAVLFGLAGLRVSERKSPDARWSLPLKEGWVLSGRVSLPKEWKKLVIPELKVLGQRYSLTVTARDSILTELK